MKEENKKTSQAAVTASEVEEKLLNGKITVNQARATLGLKPMSDDVANSYLVKHEEKPTLVKVSEGTWKMRLRSYLIRKLLGNHITIFIDKINDGVEWPVSYELEVADSKRRWLLFRADVQKLTPNRYRLKRYDSYYYRAYRSGFHEQHECCTHRLV